MARGRKRGRSGGESQELPVEAEHGRGRGGGGRAPSGPDFAPKAALGSGVVAAGLAFVAVLGVTKAAGGSDSTATMDLGGVQAVRMLAAFDTGRWDPEFGMQQAHRRRVIESLQAKIEEATAADSRNEEPLKAAVADWRKGNEAEGEEWRPGFDTFFPEGGGNDPLVGVARRSGMERVQRVRGALHSLAVIDGAGGALFVFGNDRIGGNEVARVGDTIIERAKGFRIYKHPLVNLTDQVNGMAEVVLTTAGAEGPGAMAAAGAAAGGAFLGAFLLTFLLCIPAVKSMQRLAGEAIALGGGDLSTRVTARGPDCVVAAAKGIQRLANMAAEGGGGAPVEPQIIHQPVPMVPIEEIAAGLAPASGFQRPDGLEIESTMKSCPDAGNDYHDIVNLAGGKIAAIVADIPVRGIPGAMYMAQIRALFRAECARSESPAEILKGVNRAFAADLPRGVYVTAMVAVVDNESGVCKVAAAQHLPLVFWKISKKASARLTTQGIALGHDQGPVFDKTIEEKAIQMERGDRVVLFTDGAITARNAAGAVYGEERFYYVVNREAPKNSAAFVNFVANDVDLFHEGSPQLDDFTIVTIRKLK